MARFGENVRRLRKSVKGLSQEGMAAHILTEEGGPMSQTHYSRFERAEFPPRATTIRRLAEGMSRAVGLSVEDVIARLLQDVPSQYDQIQRVQSESERAWLDRLWILIAKEPPENRAGLMAAIEKGAQEVVLRRKTDT